MDLFIIRFHTTRVAGHYKNIFRALVFYFDIKNIAQSQGPILVKNLNFLHFLNNCLDFFAIEINIIGSSGVYVHFTFITMNLLFLLNNI